MDYLLKILSDMLQNPQPLSHFHICPKPKSQIQPHRFVLGDVAEIQNFPTCHQDLSMEKPATRGRRVHLHTLVHH